MSKTLLPTPLLPARVRLPRGCRHLRMVDRGSYPRVAAAWVRPMPARGCRLTYSRATVALAVVCPRATAA